MVLTIDLTAAEEARLTAAASHEGVEPAVFFRNLVNSLPPAPRFIGTASAREAAIRSARGSMAHVGVTVDDLHRERHVDKTRDERMR